jgi:pimeloyl-ACP methyl ester carboxylesterase
MYPDDVSGLVLVDPTTEDFYARARREQPTAFDSVDAEDQKRSAAGPAGERAEEASWDSSMAQARQSAVGWRLPTILLSSPRADLGVLGPVWTDEQRRLAERMPNTRFVLVAGVGHAIHRDRPAAVFDAVREVLRYERPGSQRQ